MREFGKDYKEDIKINRYNLVEDVEMQPSLVQYYSEKCTDADIILEAAKIKVKQVEAEKYIYYQINPGAIKPTGEVTKAQVESDPDVKVVKDEYIVALDEYNTYKSALEAVRAKGDMLKLMVNLLIGGFFSTIKTNSDKEFE